MQALKKRCEMNNLVKFVLISTLLAGAFGCSAGSAEKAAADARVNAADARAIAADADARVKAADAHVKAADARVKAADAGVGLMCAAILLISCTVGVDMQQDRSTGWRLGTNRAAYRPPQLRA